ncbi:MAG TPA: SRPBCC family protein [Kofleriaceae bacterium]|nr:SRPBCC family protein [Kofleriaceae bacterium]
MQRTQTVPHPRREVFAFFADAANLERITPPFLGFQILTPRPIAIRAGTLIDYRIRLHGIPLTWQTRIEHYIPEDHFVDVQLRGPYRTWRHLHEFVVVPGGTEIRDTVDYELPLGPLGSLAHALFVKRQLATIFDYRRRIITELFGPGEAQRAVR